MMDKEEYLKRKQAHKEYVSGRNTPEEILDLYVTQCFDTIDDEKEFDRLALQIFDAEYVDGDSYSVPCPLDMFEKAVGLVKELQAEIERLKTQNDRLLYALSPRAWDTDMNNAWHKNIPDVVKAFQAIMDEALNQQDKD